MLEWADELKYRIANRKPAERSRLLARFASENVMRVLKEAERVEAELMRALG
jgi:hypothetical protein